MGIVEWIAFLQECADRGFMTAADVATWDDGEQHHVYHFRVGDEARANNAMHIRAKISRIESRGRTGLATIRPDNVVDDVDLR